MPLTATRYRLSAAAMSACVIILAACSEQGSAPDSNSDSAPPAASPAESVTPAIPRTAAPAGARVFIVEPTEGATVSGTFKVVFGIENATVVPAGTAAADGGHHHLLIDAPLPDMSLPVPNNEQYRHFGGAQTQVELTLAPGEHTLQLLLGDHLHVPHDPPVVSDPITITVAE